jgi:hypothetical protein
MGAVRVRFNTAFVAAGFFSFGGVAAGKQQRRGADEQGEEFDLFHAFVCLLFSCAGHLHRSESG